MGYVCPIICIIQTKELEQKLGQDPSAGMMELHYELRLFDSRLEALTHLCSAHQWWSHITGKLGSKIMA